MPEPGAVVLERLKLRWWRIKELVSEGLEDKGYAGLTPSEALRFLNDVMADAEQLVIDLHEKHPEL